MSQIVVRFIIQIQLKQNNYFQIQFKKISLELDKQFYKQKKDLLIKKIQIKNITGVYQQNPYNINLGEQGLAYNKYCSRHVEFEEGKPGAGGFAFLGKAIKFRIKALKNEAKLLKHYHNLEINKYICIFNIYFLIV
ncbi:hypothetical protein TTHERM_01284720 (macronuclear) [Tetrahymena thermophila SB210]|uniref:Uncharacterized protein n=1 Tax=Tetrahymena thermophila (strain SB210) TaxID=312017 RepID=Q24HS3_TETTS|nr:hypothetical protein TTHERM_01284720 [Tetrahymena thermophila SB210]EAS07322.1 hypothetical protein TTHERM_01284720 [Tetrahymena thermophila SB210]|eukprot:XP_001027564.1 hypothetical protein TTHERM_01284720 [Tetrahymena thermophila SB210]